MTRTRFRPTAVEVDLDAVRHNAAALKPADAELMAVVKANGYGHGGGRGRRARRSRPARPGAASRWWRRRSSSATAGIEAPILVLSEFPPGAEAVALARRLTPVLYSRGGLARVAAAGARCAAVHVKVDTGMHRVGVWPPEDLPAFLSEVAAAGLRDRGDLDAPRARARTIRGDPMQLVRSCAALDAAEARRVRPPACGTRRTAAAVLRHPESHFDLVRPGIALYGVGPEPGVGADLGLRPALTWRSAVAFARRARRRRAGRATASGTRSTATPWWPRFPSGTPTATPATLSSRADVLIAGGAAASPAASRWTS